MKTKKMTMLELLKGALKLIKDMKGWTQHMNAATASNRFVDIQSDSAKRFCAGGALLRVSGWDGGSGNRPPLVKRAVKALNAASGGDIIDTNDRTVVDGKKRTKTECHRLVVAAYRKAIRTETAKVKAKAA